MDALRENLELVVIIVAVVIIAILVPYICTYRETKTVLIQNRYWNYSLAVRYDTTITEVICSTEHRCSGSGDNRTCTTETSCNPETRTVTQTRCKTARSGEALPPVRPSIPCQMYRGDYLSESIDYYVAYRVAESDNIKSARFGGEIWYDLEPGKLVRITMTAWDWITNVEVAR